MKFLGEKAAPFFYLPAILLIWDFVLSVATKLYPKFAAVYRQANNPYVDKEITDSRSNFNVRLIAKGSAGVRELIKCIKSSYSIVMLVDQKMNDGIEVPFFGKPSMTSQGIAQLALRFDYPILPLRIIRKKGSYFKISIGKPIKIVKTGNAEKDCYEIMLSINLLLEEWIRERPGEWFWFHNRWPR